MLPLLTSEDEIRWALKVSKCKRCKPQCWEGQVYMWAFAKYRNEIDGIKNWEKTVDEVSDCR